MQHISIRSQISRSTIHIDKSVHPSGQSHLAALLTGMLSLSTSLLVSPPVLAQSAPEAEDSLANYPTACWSFFLEPHLPGNFALSEPNCSPKLKPPQIEKGRETYIILPFGEGATLQARISAANPPMLPLPSTSATVDLNDWIGDIDFSWEGERSDEFPWEPLGRTLNRFNHEMTLIQAGEFSWEPVGRNTSTTSSPNSDFLASSELQWRENLNSWPGASFDRMFNEPAKIGGGQVSILAPNLIPNLTPTNRKPTIGQYTGIDDFGQSPEHPVLSLFHSEYELTTERESILQTAILTLTSEMHNWFFPSTVSEVKSNDSYGSSSLGSSSLGSSSLGSSSLGSSSLGSSFLLAGLPQPEVFEPFCQPVTTLFEEWSGSRNAWLGWPLRSVESLPSLQNPIFCSLTQNLKFQ